MSEHTPPHPTQPLVVDDAGKARFRANPIVRFLLDHGPHNLDSPEILDAADDDREQLAQLIGYSVSGFSALSYANNDTVEVVNGEADDLLRKLKAEREPSPDLLAAYKAFQESFEMLEEAIAKVEGTDKEVKP